MNYLIGTGYTGKQEQFDRWLANTIKYSRPQKIAVLALDGTYPDVAEGNLVDVLSVTGNAGHGESLIGKRTPLKPHPYSGWSATVCSLAMAAYAGELDFIFKEEDALCFGSWITVMYEALGDANIVFGAPMKLPPYMPSHQSVFLVRHFAIPRFVEAYLNDGDERSPLRLVEHKFAMLRAKMTYGHLPATFVDRMRPIPYDARVFAAQQFTPAELAELKRRGLI